MFFHSLLSQFKTWNKNPGKILYRIHHINYINTTEVDCEIKETGQIVTLKLDDIIENKIHQFSLKEKELLLKALKNKKSVLNNGSKSYRYYHIFTTAFIFLLISANVGALKICNFFGNPIDAGTLIFPFLYIISDIVTELYGFTKSRRMIW